MLKSMAVQRIDHVDKGEAFLMIKKIILKKLKVKILKENMVKNNLLKFLMIWIVNMVKCLKEKV